MEEKSLNFCQYPVVEATNVQELGAQLKTLGIDSAEAQVVLRIPDGTTVIADYAFQNCLSIIDIVFPEGLLKIGEYAFDYCKNLQRIVLPRSLKSVGKYAFADHKNLHLVQLSWNTKITQNALETSSELNGHLFGNFKSLKSARFELQYSPDDNYECMFRGCSSLESFEWSAPITKIPYGFFENCSKLTMDNIRICWDNVKAIGNAAFKGCTSLTSLVLPDSVEEIGSEAFYDCSNLTSVTIPSVTSIGRWAFRDCTALKEITVKSADLLEDAMLPEGVKIIECA